jgi:alkanesulfonate monooxygenase SsuD/methylene tetrahydromethanopterin reductase-like flavin-dependent oxidoreductase (luciferase family)
MPRCATRWSWPRTAEALGYERFWVSEHHGMPTIVGTAPEVLMAAIAARTRRIRIGSAGVMLPHYSAFKVAESFRVLDALAPGRIDRRGPRPGQRPPHRTGPQPACLGHGRGLSRAGAGPAGPGERAAAPRPRRPPLPAARRARRTPEVWILGSSDYGAQLAAHLGLPYAFAYFFMDGRGVEQALELYRRLYRPSAATPASARHHLRGALAADTDEQARHHALSRERWRVDRMRGLLGPLRPPGSIEEEGFTAAELPTVQALRARAFVGSAPRVARAAARELAASLGLDELVDQHLGPRPAGAAPLLRAAGGRVRHGRRAGIPGVRGRCAPCSGRHSWGELPSPPGLASAQRGGTPVEDSFDYVIVGGGSAGSVLAGRLGEDPSGARVPARGRRGRLAALLIHCPAGLAAMAKREVRELGLRDRAAARAERPARLPAARPRARWLQLDQRHDLRARPPQRLRPLGREGNPGWSWHDVLPYFRRAEHNERGADAFHGSGGPLNVMDVRSPCRHADDFVRAGVQAGYAETADFNGAQFEGVGRYQVHAPQRRALQRRQGLPHAAPGPHQPARAHRRAHHPCPARRPPAPWAWNCCSTGSGCRCAPVRGAAVRRGAAVAAAAHALRRAGPGAHLQGLRVCPWCTSCPAWDSSLHDHIDVVQVVNAPHLRRPRRPEPDAGRARCSAASASGGAQRSGMLTTNFAEAGGFVRSQPRGGRARPAAPLRHRQARRPRAARRSSATATPAMCACCAPRAAAACRLDGADPMAAPLHRPRLS